MKTIAVMTVLFLPATFVATLFSMTIFDFNNESGRPKVSKYIWIYVIIAVVLTALVFAGWRVWWSWENRRFQQEIGTMARHIDRREPSRVTPILGDPEGEMHVGMRGRLASTVARVDRGWTRSRAAVPNEPEDS